MENKERKAYEAAMEEYFANGGKVTVCAIDERSEEAAKSVWGKRKKSKKEVDESAQFAIMYV